MRKGDSALHPLTLDRLEEALRQRGCPVCWEMERASRRYLRQLLREGKASEKVWERLQKSRGLCREHTHGLLGEEMRTIRGHSTATLYRWLIDALLEEAGRRALPSLLEAREMCLACEQLGEYERAVIGNLLRLLASGDPPGLKAAYLNGDGLCLPHLRIALAVTDDRRIVDLLGERFVLRLRTLATELEEFVEAHSPTAGRQSKPESDVWRRAAEQFVGKLESPR